MFYGITSHLIALGFILLLAGILWVASASNRIAYDYVVGRQFALLLALIALGSMDISTRLFTVPNLYRIQFVFVILEAIFALRMTASILRFTREFSGRVAGGVAIATVLTVAFTPWTWIETRGLSLAVSVLLPFVYGLSAFLIGSRVHQMRGNRVGASRERMRFLYVSGATFAATAIAYLIESSSSHGLEVQWSRSLNLVLIFFLVRMFFKNRRARILFSDSLPISEHHRETSRTDASALNGWMVAVQLAPPQSWMGKGRDGQRPGRFAEQNVQSHICSALEAHGAKIVRMTESVTYFFFASDTTVVVDAIAGLDNVAEKLSDRILFDTDEGIGRPVLSFKAAILFGALRPSNQGADWETVGAVDMFVEAERLLAQADESTDGDESSGKAKSAVIVQAREFSAFQRLTPKLTLIAQPTHALRAVA
jgi:hypothetical protein